MRLVVLNPHVEHLFSKTVFYFLTRKKFPPKYAYMSEEGEADGNIAYLFDMKKASVGNIAGFLARFRFIVYLEIRLWAVLNGINPKRTPLIFDISKLQPDDVIYFFCRREFGKNSTTLLRGISQFKVGNLSHFLFDTSEVAECARRYQVDLLVSEAHLKTSTFAVEAFGELVNRTYQIPFAVQRRFLRKKSFEERQRKCFATGTVQSFPEKLLVSHLKEWYSFYKTNIFHPMRMELYLNRDRIRDHFSVIMGDWDENTKQKEQFQEKRSGVFQWIKQVYLKVFASQNKYYGGFDMVDMMNNHQLFIVPEELGDVPGIGFVEGMACGCAYVGKKADMYEKLGMQAGCHYLGYSGDDLESVKTLVADAIKKPDELKRIANQGWLFATKNFNPQFIYRLFCADLMAMLRKRPPEGPIAAVDVVCGFNSNRE